MTTTVKVKFRPSTVEDRPGTIVYLVTHRRIARQITTGYKETPLFEKSRVQIVQNITIIIQNIPSCIIQSSTSHQGCISLKALLSS